MSAIMLFRMIGFLLLGTFLFAGLLFLIGATGGRYLKRKKQKTKQKTKHLVRIAKEWVVLAYLITILILILGMTILVH